MYVVYDNMIIVIVIFISLINMLRLDDWLYSRFH